MPYFVLCKERPKWKQRVYALNPSSLAIRDFPAVSLNIYHWRFCPPMNHVSILEADTLVTKKKKIKQSVVKWYEPNCAFQIINFYLSYPLLLFLFIIHFSISLSYYFLPSTFSGTHVRTVITGSYAPIQVTTGKPSLPNTWKRWKNKLLTWVGRKSSLFWLTNSLEKHISVVLWVSKTSYRSEQVPEGF